MCCCIIDFLIFVFICEFVIVFFILEGDLCVSFEKSFFEMCMKVGYDIIVFFFEDFMEIL